ncbi:hypothetical protein ABEB36_007576 [Hypothenemus hampei]|uniref:Gustatory receptor n=1 Tax=Hypothenemus hampei TaxID=57062 RepID=A0ABD1EUP0_HYPHA
MTTKLKKKHLIYYISLGPWGAFLTVLAFKEILQVEQYRNSIIFESLLLIFSSICTCVGMTVSILRRDIWKQLIQELSLIENIQNLNTFEEKESSFAKTVTLSNLFFFHVYRSMYTINIGYIIFNANILFNIIEDKYKGIENLLLQSKGPMNTILIRKSRILYDRMQKVSRILNKLIGIPIFCIFFYCGYKAVYISAFNYKTYMKRRGLDTKQLATDIIINGIIVIIPLFVLFFAHQTNSQVTKLQNTCAKLMEKLNEESERYLELNDFYEQMKHQRVKFTAAKFFDLERSTIIRYLDVISTYFIAVIQFDISKK